MNLYPVDNFKSNEDFVKTKKKIIQLVDSGELVSEGLDENERVFFIEKYRGLNGELWLLAVPDQAFRGYLRKQ